MAITAEEHRKFTLVYEKAHSNSVLNDQESSVFAMALGDRRSFTNGGWTRGTDVATKAAVTQIVYLLIDLYPGLKQW